MVISITEYNNQLREQDILYESFLQNIKDKFKNSNFVKSLDNKQKNSKLKLKQSQQKLENTLKNQNINVVKLKQIIVNHSNKAFKKISSVGGIKNPKESSKILAQEVSLLFGTIKDSDILDNIENFSKSTLIAIGIFSIVLYINTTLLMLLMIYASLPFNLAMSITAVFVAPLTEEFAKYFSIKFAATGQFWFIFNIAEFLTYVAMMVAGGIPILVASFIRLMVICMHTITTYIMYYYRKHSEKGNENTKIGLIAGVIIHFFWNLSAVLPLVKI